MALLHLLLVEDDHLARAQLVAMLTRASISCRGYRDAHEALHHLRGESFDVIATDWNLGTFPTDMDGVTFSRTTRELGIRTPILL